MEYVIQFGQLLLGISILVVLHEGGHYIAARAFKTRVESFYLFFNPWFSIYKKKIGDTEYGIGWLPLGGYVKIAGMMDESMDKDQMAKDPEPWEFRSKPTWQRLIIMLGGVIVNIIVAFVIYAMVLFTWGETYVPTQNVKYGVYCDSLAIDLGFQNGDHFIALNGEEIVDDVTYGKITKDIILGRIQEVTVKRESGNKTISIPDEFWKKIVAKGVKGLFVEQVPFVIDSLMPSENAEKAGLQKGDKIIGLDDQEIEYFTDFALALQSKKDKDVAVTVLRNNQEVTKQVHVSKEGRIGAYNSSIAKYFEIVKKDYGFFESIPAGYNETGEMLSDYLVQMKFIFSKEGASQLGGFGTIAKIYGPEWIWERFWRMTAMISVMLAVMNLLPIPALDGGHVMFLSYEMITKRKPNEKLMEYAQMGGMLLLLSFMLYANGMDIVRAWF